MIQASASVRVERIPLECLQVKCHYDEPREPSRVLHYYQKFMLYPGAYAGILSVVPSDTHPNMYCILDGHHRYLASILANRRDALCLVIEDDPAWLDRGVKRLMTCLSHADDEQCAACAEDA